MKKIDFSNLIPMILSQKNEQNITEFKQFYKTHLTAIQNRNIVLNRILGLYNKFQEFSQNALTKLADKKKLDGDAKLLLKEYFGNKILEIYNKEIAAPNSRTTFGNSDNSFISFLQDVARMYEANSQHEEQVWSYKTNFIGFIHKCLLNYGLHQDIQRRDTKTYKRYNILVTYFQTSKTRRTKGRLLFSQEVLELEYLIPYEKQLPIQIEGKIIQAANIDQLIITSTLLLDDELELFAAKNKFNWSEHNKDKAIFIKSCHDETDQLLKNPHLSDKKNEHFRNGNICFVNPIRIDELRGINSNKFDLAKLIQLCEELNNAFITETIYTPLVLLRAIIDHVPPIFGFKTFAEVANNYSDGGKSFKKVMLHLDSPLRNIADHIIHSPVRKKEALPTKNQVDFTQELDLLLSEIVRILK